MSKKKFFTGIVTVLTLGLLGMATAQASIISATPNIDFTSSDYTLSLASGAASFGFQNAGPGGFLGYPQVAIKTGGSGLVATVFGEPSAYFTGSRSPYIDENLLATFESYDTYTTVPYSSTDTYLAFAFDLADGRHYGYAEVSGPQLLAYGYQTIAGEGILAGAVGSSPTPVPEPGSLAMLSLGLVLIGIGTATARRREN